MNVDLCQSSQGVGSGEPHHDDACIQKAMEIKEAIAATTAAIKGQDYSRSPQHEDPDSSEPLGEAVPLAGSEGRRQLGLRPIPPPGEEESDALQAELLCAKDAAKRADDEVQALRAALAEAETAAAKKLAEQTAAMQKEQAAMQKELQAAQENIAREAQEKESLKAELNAAKDAAKLILYSESPLPLHVPLR